MRTKTLENLNNKYISEKILLPEFILEEINKKGFYVYEWIDQKELKTSIEIEFLNKIFYLGPVGIVLAVLAFIIFNIPGVIISIGLFSIIIVIYVIFLSISRTLKASKINYLIVTNKYFSLNRKIGKIEDGCFITIDEESQELGKLFKENLFFESYLEQEKSKSRKKISSLVFDGFGFIFKSDGRNSKDSAQIIIILLFIYLAFIITMLTIYFLGIFLAIVVGVSINFLLKHYLILKGNQILIINDYFKDIENASNILKKEQILLKNYLNQASKNNWQDGLLLKINSGIEMVNKNAKKAMEENSRLINELKDSEFDKIFDYGVYNSWIKKQISEPIKGIIKMLEENIFIINQEIEKNEETIKNTNDEKIKGHLEISKNRLKIKKDEIENHLTLMKGYLSKLES